MASDQPQLTLEEMRALTPQEIVAARKDGRLRDIMQNGDPQRKRGYGVPYGPREPKQGKDWGDIVAARKSGQQ